MIADHMHTHLRLDLGGYHSTVGDAADAARAAQDAGYDGWWSTETKHDPFLSSAVAIERTERIQVGTAIAVAFARNPMNVAVMANDLHGLSAGRFALGLGSQVEAHITKRFSMPWSPPAQRMREFVIALRAIWAAFDDGTPPRHEGELYRHTLLPPFFDPGPSPYGHPDVLIAAVGPRMTAVAGEVGDGILCHTFTTAGFLRDVTVPELARGRARTAAGPELDGFKVCVNPFVVLTAERDEDTETAVAFVRSQIAFYGSTSAYRPVLEHHGWGHLQGELATLARRGEWDAMSVLIDDDLFNAMVVAGSPGQVAQELQDRFGDVASRAIVSLAPTTSPELTQQLALAFSRSSATGA